MLCCQRHAGRERERKQRAAYVMTAANGDVNSIHDAVRSLQ